MTDRSVVHGRQETGISVPAGITRGGGPGDDTLVGTTLVDTLRGGGGDDLVVGGNGDDTLTGGVGDDKIWGERITISRDETIDPPDAFADYGDDRIWGGDGDDSVFAGNGNDTLFAGSGNDFALGESSSSYVGEDFPIGTGEDVFYGGYGDDVLLGIAGDDQLKGGRGNDHLDGESDNDTLWGGDGDDHLIGDYYADDISAGFDLLYGGNGNDSLTDDGGALFFGGRGDDILRSDGDFDAIVPRLYGGDGDDSLIGMYSDMGFVFVGGDGDDWIGLREHSRAYGGTGRDLFQLEGYQDRSRISDFNVEEDRLVFDSGGTADGVQVDVELVERGPGRLDDVRVQIVRDGRYVVQDVLLVGLDTAAGVTVEII